EDLIAGGAVAIRVYGPSHTLVRITVGEQRVRFVVDLVLVCSHQHRHARLDSFGPFGGLAHYENRLAEGGGFFLNPAGVGQDQVRVRDGVYELEIIHGLGERDAWMVS